MIDRNLQNQLSLTLMRASLKGKYGMVALAEANGITLQQAITLCLLEPEQGVRMNTVATYLTCDPSTVTGLVDRLFTLGFINRKEGATDRRQKLISLTDSGMKLRSALLEIATTKRFPDLDTLSPAETREFIRLINKASGGASLATENQK